MRSLIFSSLAIVSVILAQAHSENSTTTVDLSKLPRQEPIKPPPPPSSLDSADLIKPLISQLNMPLPADFLKSTTSSPNLEVQSFIERELHQNFCGGSKVAALCSSNGQVCAVKVSSRSCHVVAFQEPCQKSTEAPRTYNSRYVAPPLRQQLKICVLTEHVANSKAPPSAPGSSFNAK